MMMNKFSEIIWGEKFKKDFKRLLKKYSTLEEDLDTLINTSIYALHKLKIPLRDPFPINNLGLEKPQIYKAKKFACRALKGKGAKTGLRLIYTYLPENDEVHLIEIYSKSDKTKEDRTRIKELFSKNITTISQ